MTKSEAIVVLTGIHYCLTHYDCNDNCDLCPYFSSMYEEEEAIYMAIKSLNEEK